MEIGEGFFRHSIFEITKDQSNGAIHSISKREDHVAIIINSLQIYLDSD